MANFKSMGIGAASGVIASLCCSLPLVIMAFGIGSISAALAISQYRLHFLAISLVVFAFALGLYLKRNPACCTQQSKRRFIFTAVATYLAIYFLVLYVIAPAIAPYVYR